MVVFLIAHLLACSNDVTDKVDDPVSDTGTADDTAPQDTSPPVDADGDGSPEGTDCDDADPDVYPGAPEICDGKDNDCEASSPSDADVDADRDGVADCQDYCPVYSQPGAAGTGSAADPVGTLQEAVDMAGGTGCNEVRAYEGTYDENVDWNGWPVNAESVKGAARTFIDGNDLGPTVTFATGETGAARISGFTITGGLGTGIETASATGGGVHVRGASPTLEGNIVTGNAADLGAGVFVADGDPDLTDMVFTSNVATRGGGGLYLLRSNAAVLDSVFEGNEAAYGGPEDGSDGGGIMVIAGAPEIVGNEIIDNAAGDGGGIWTARSDALIAQNLVQGNLADDVPVAGEEAKDGQGGGINIQNSGSASGTRVLANLVIDNEASVIGGGIALYEGVVNSTTNTITQVAATVENNTVVGNRVTGVVSGGSTLARGAGIGRYINATCTVRNNLVAYNDGAAGISSHSGTEATGVTFTFAYNLSSGHTTNVEGNVGTHTGYLSLDPAFTAWSDDGNFSNDTFTLTTGSPGRNSGDPSIRDADGSASDLGSTGGMYGW